MSEDAGACSNLKTKPRGSLGAGRGARGADRRPAGRLPSRDGPRRPIVVVRGPIHGVAACGVSAYPSEVTAQMVAKLSRAAAPRSNVLAREAGRRARGPSTPGVAVPCDDPLVRLAGGSGPETDSIVDGNRRWSVRVAASRCRGGRDAPRSRLAARGYRPRRHRRDGDRQHDRSERRCARRCWASRPELVLRAVAPASTTPGWHARSDAVSRRRRSRVNPVDPADALGIPGGRSAASRSPSSWA